MSMCVAPYTPGAWEPAGGGGVGLADTSALEYAVRTLSASSDPDVVLEGTHPVSCNFDSAKIK